MENDSERTYQFAHSRTMKKEKSNNNNKKREQDKEKAPPNGTIEI